MKNKDALLIIFAKNPELGKVKTRLAADVGDAKALEIYRFLLQHTLIQTKNLAADKVIYFSENLPQESLFPKEFFSTAIQKGKDLGERMENAFQDAFRKEYKKVIIIGTDLPDITSEDIRAAFRFLDKNDYVFGPARDGGYYLLGMKCLNSALFQNINWSTATVFKESLAAIPENKSVKLLQTKNDIDTLKDIEPNSVLNKFLDKK